VVQHPPSDREPLLGGRAAVVTGGSRGIGRVVARALAAHGASVIVNGREPGPVDEVVAAIEAVGGVAAGHAGSVADFEFARALVDGCVARFGAIDILVNCAGVAEPEGSSILDLSAEGWRALIDAHLTSTFNACRHAAPHMTARGAGAIVNTSSHSYLGHYGGTGYPAGKGGVNSLSFAMAAELAEHGVRVNAICPGARTRLSTGPGYERQMHRLHARGLLDDALLEASLAPPDAEHCAAMYVLLASDLAAGVTGRLFSAVGGYVGLHARGSETPVGFHNVETEGEWSLTKLADRVRSAVAEDLGR